MSEKIRKLTAVCVLISLVVVGGTTQANWSETFDGGTFDLPTWQFHAWPQLDPPGTFTAIIKDGPGDNDYLALAETTSVGASPPGSAFGGGFASDEDFTDVRVGTVLNVVGDASRNLCGLLGRTFYFVDDGSVSGAPGIVASCYVLLVNWEQGPANLQIELQKVVYLSHIMDIDYEVAVPGLDHARSYYAQLDIVGSDPAYITGSLYEYKGGPLVAKIPTLIDTSANDPWEDPDEPGIPGNSDLPFASGVSGITGFNEDAEPAGYYCTFDDVFSISDGPAAVPLSPADGATGVSINAELTWVEAAFATSRDLWFGKEGAMEEVAPAPTGTTYDPGALEFGQTYQWRVDEIGPSGTVEGFVWTFTTGECLSVDDFESYADNAAIEAAWPHSITEPPNLHYIFIETGQVHQGGKSMRFHYENQYAPFRTEATRTFNASQDWTAAGAEALSLFFRGEDDNVEQPMYVKLTDAATQSATVTHPYTHAVQSESWHEWSIDLKDFSDGGVSLASVKKITIGFGDGVTSSGQVDMDTVYIDQLRLCPPRCFNIEQLDLRGDANGDCRVNFDDFAVMADSWLNDGLAAAP